METEEESIISNLESSKEKAINITEEFLILKLTAQEASEIVIEALVTKFIVLSFFFLFYQSIFVLPISLKLEIKAFPNFHRFTVPSLMPELQIRFAMSLTF